MSRVWLLALTAAVSVACAPTDERPVSLTGTWPSETGDYAKITERWTRHDRVRGDIDEHLTEIVSVSATLLSPEWRAAYVARRADDERLPPARRQALLDAQRERDASYYEVMLLVRANERRLIDFDRGERSVWRVALSDGDQREIEAIAIERDRRLHSVIREYFPHMGDFDQAFLVRFPRDLELFGDAAARIELLMASPRATLQLAWEDA